MGSELLSSLTEQFTAMVLALNTLSEGVEQTPLFISVDSDHQLVDFRTPGIDLAIRFGFTKTSWPGVEARHLVSSPLSPVLSPDLFDDPTGLRSAIESGRIPLIHDDSREAWRLWLAAAGMDVALAERGYSYTDTTLVVQAALRGQGIAMPCQVWPWSVMILMADVSCSHSIFRSGKAPIMLSRRHSRN